MSSKKQSLVEPEIGYGYGYVISDFTLDNILGKILTILESIGLPEKQESAIKGLMKQAVNEDRPHHVELDPKLHTLIRLKSKETDPNSGSTSDYNWGRTVTLEDIK